MTLDYRELRVETIEEGHRRSMKIIHLPTLVAVEGVGEHVSRKQLRAMLMPELATAVQTHLRRTPPNGGKGSP